MYKKGLIFIIISLAIGLTYIVGYAAQPSNQVSVAPRFPRLFDQVNQKSVSLIASTPLSTTFTYQGFLTDEGNPANGLYDFKFLLFDDPNVNNQVGLEIALEDYRVVDGLFTVELDFGEVFDGRALWLETQVRPGSDMGGFTVLSPRQALTAAPYALNALSLRPGAIISGVITNTQMGVLNLNNTQGDGLIINEVSGNGVRVNSTGGGIGLYVGSAAQGVRIDSAQHGVEVYSVSNDGFRVFYADGRGLFVNSADNDGVYINSAGDEGVHVSSAGADGVHVSQAEGNGVYAASSAADQYGGHFVNTAEGGGGLHASAGDNGTPDVVLGGSSGILSSDPTENSSGLYLDSYDDTRIRLDLNDDDSGFFYINNGAGQIVLIVDESGNLTASGTKSAMVEMPDDGQVRLYALESPENWFEDFGTASLVSGEASVTIEPNFAATVNLEDEYHVFLTPLGDCALYVTEKNLTSFTVRALNGTTCSIDFDYRIVAKRLGYEDLRLEPVDLQPDREEE